MMQTMFLAFVLCAGLVLAGCGGGSSKEGTTAAPAADDADAPAEDLTGNSDSIAGDTDTAPEIDTSMFSFVLDGKKYTLPFDYKQLEADGWTPDDDYENMDIGGMTYTNIYMHKDDKVNMDFVVYNGGGNKKKVAECPVSGVIGYSQVDSYSFSLDNGIKAGDDEETVTKAMGDPTYKQDDDIATSIRYGEDDDQGITFSWFKEEDGSGISQAQIEMKLFIPEEAETSQEVPAYLSEYQAPTSISDDFDKATFSLDQVVYQLPCPVSEFVKNGWTIEEDKNVAADQFELLTFLKGDVALNCFVTNFSDEQTTGANCAVTEITGDSYAAAPDMVLPRNVSFATTEAQLKKAIKGSSAEFYTSEDSDSVTYSSYIEDPGITWEICYNTEQKKILSMEVKVEKWPGKN